MRKIKEVLRLKYECRISEREIARSCQVSRSTVADYLRRASAAGIISWTEATKLVEADIENRVFPIQPGLPPAAAATAGIRLYSPATTPLP